MEVPCQIKILPPPPLPTPTGCTHTASAHKRRETVLDASEHHKGPGQDRVDPACLNMSNCPIMYLLLLLLGFQAPQAQGRPFTTHQLEKFSAMIDEIMEILDKSPLPSQVSNWDKAGIGQGGMAGASVQQDSWTLSSSTPKGPLGPE